MSQLLVTHRVGRVVLHTICALRDHHWNWHWRGIVREFSRHWFFIGEHCSWTPEFAGVAANQFRQQRGSVVPPYLCFCDFLCRQSGNCISKLNVVRHQGILTKAIFCQTRMSQSVIPTVSQLRLDQTKTKTSRSKNSWQKRKNEKPWTLHLKIITALTLRRS